MSKRASDALAAFFEGRNRSQFHADTGLFEEEFEELYRNYCVVSKSLIPQPKHLFAVFSFLKNAPTSRSGALRGSSGYARVWERIKWLYQRVGGLVTMRSLDTAPRLPGGYWPTTVGSIDSVPVFCENPRVPRGLYCGKHKKTALKFHVAVRHDGVPFWFSGPHPGSVHDAKLFQQLSPPLPPNKHLLADNGYVGCGAALVLPNKRTNGECLTDREKVRTFTHAFWRAGGEHVFADIKTWRVIGERSRLTQSAAGISRVRAAFGLLLCVLVLRRTRVPRRDLSPNGASITELRRRLFRFANDPALLANLELPESDVDDEEDARPVKRARTAPPRDDGNNHAVVADAKDDRTNAKDDEKDAKNANDDAHGMEVDDGDVWAGIDALSLRPRPSVPLIEDTGEAAPASVRVASPIPAPLSAPSLSSLLLLPPLLPAPPLPLSAESPEARAVLATLGERLRKQVYNELTAKDHAVRVVAMRRAQEAAAVARAARAAEAAARAAQEAEARVRASMPAMNVETIVRDALDRAENAKMHASLSAARVSIGVATRAQERWDRARRD